MAIFMRETVVLCCFKRVPVMVPSSAEIAILIVSWWSSSGIFARGEKRVYFRRYEENVCFRIISRMRVFFFSRSLKLRYVSE